MGLRISRTLQATYLDPGTAGLDDFIDNRIDSSQHLAATIIENRGRYEAARSSSQQIQTLTPKLRAVFRNLKALYPAAVFPDVYFVIGALNSGGMSSPRGLIIGAEMYPELRELPAIVAHELIHFQQQRGSGRWRMLWRRSLLERAFLEGSADFLGGLIAGHHINTRAHEYGLPREAALWDEFQTHMDETDTSAWLYGGSVGDRPSDLGYFIGYRIAHAYYERADNKTTAIEGIVNPRDVAALLVESGYDP